MKNILSITIGLAVLVVISTGRAQAQNKSEHRSYIITNGDTIINGKNIADLSPKEREDLKKEFKELEKGIHADRKERRIIIRKNGDEKEYSIELDDKDAPVLHWDDNAKERFHFEFRGPGDRRVYSFRADSLMNGVTDSLLKRFSYRFDSSDSTITDEMLRFRNFFRAPMPNRSVSPLPPNANYYFPTLGARNNSSRFNYSYVDKDGIPSRMNISVSDANEEKFKEITGSTASSNTLEVKDLMLTPNFSTGTMNLSFNLDSRGSTKLEIKGSDMSTIFSDNTTISTGSYMKQISLPKNGVYYISINQGDKWAVKRIVKE